MNQFARPGLAVTELPSFNENDKGKVLKINESSGELGWEKQDDPLPPVSSSDNGKVLGVVDGAWAAQGDIVLNASLGWTGSVFAITVTSDPPSEDDIASCFKSARGIMLVFSEHWKVRLSCVGFDYDSGSLSNFYNFAGFANNFDERKCTYYLQFQFANGECVGCGGSGTYGDKFVVNLTPTAVDYSGTMDHTVAEINAAYEAGMEIWFEISAGTITEQMFVDAVGYGSDTYPSFETKFIASGSLFVRFFTSMTNDGTKQTYSAEIYTLTPAS